MHSTPLKFKDFELDPVSYQLLCKGSQVKLERIPMELLLFLASRPGELVTRAEIIEKLWGKDVFLDTENGINTAIRKVRLALQDDPEEPRFVLTVAGRGYRFIAPIHDQDGKDWLSPKKGASSQIDLPAPDKSPGRLRKGALWLGTAVIASAGVVFLARFITRTPKPVQPIRISAEIGADASLYTEYGPAAILSPDGTRLAFVATDSGQRRRIYVRSLDQLQAAALAGTEGAYDHFFSPDGQWLGFFADGKLKKVSAQGGAVVVLCDVLGGRGASWGQDGTIVYTPSDRAGLLRVSSTGGTPQVLTTLDGRLGEATQRWPQVLPGGSAVLFTSSTVGVDYEDSELVVYSILSKQRKTVVRNATYGRYVPTGHLIYMHQGTLFAVPFDLKHLEVVGQATPVLEDVVSVALHGGAQYSISNTGNLVYTAGPNNILDLSLFWMDRQGKFTPLRETPGAYYTPVFSPDGKQLAITIYDGKKSEVWVYEWQRDILSRLTSDSAGDYYPIWTPDGQRITYVRTEKDGRFSLYWRRADGTGDVQRLAGTQTPASLGSCSWSPNGKVLAFTQINPKAPLDIYTLSVDGDEKTGWKFSEPTLFLKHSFFPAFSPDGRWIAYSSDDSGSWEVYVRPFPGPGGKSQVSTAGGLFPKWSRNSKELLYRSLDGKMVVAKYRVSADSFHADKPQLWSPGQLTHRGGDPTFDLHPDGKRFAVLKPLGSGEPAPVNKVRFVFNFFDKLRREVPPER